MMRHIKFIARVGLVVSACFLLTGVARGDFVLGEPTNLGPIVNSPAAEWCPCLSSDGLELYFGCSRPIKDLDFWNLWKATRQTADHGWGEPSPVGSDINSAYEEGFPQLSRDDLQLYFYSQRGGGHGGTDIWVATRPTTSDPWGPATNLGASVNTSQHELGAAITADGLELFFSRTPGTAAGFDIWMTTRATPDAPWGPAVRLGPTINSSASEICYSVSPDGLALFFSGHGSGAFRAGGAGGPDIWVATRPTRQDPWNAPFSMPGNTAYSENCPSVSADGRWLYFDDWGATRPGGYGSDDIWLAPIIPITDFDGDGKVEGAEILLIADHWGTDDSLCDIGPMPWGDGIVDVEDLKVLAEYIGEPVDDPTLVAYWALDEANGEVAYDSVADSNGMLLGEPIWEPEGGMLGGALQLDGVDDCIETSFVLDPSTGPFSILAWVQGGAPGQVIVCQAGGATWLIVQDDGVLGTELTGAGASSLISATCITDGNWHRVGQTWDGFIRTLYVDGVAVAADIQPGLGNHGTNLYIGAAGPGNRRRASTFFSGLIDDVRIYNRAVKP